MSNRMVGGYCSKFLCGIDLNATIDRIVSVLTPFTQQYDTIAFRGMSGAIVAPACAARLKKDLIMVRKRDDSHSQLSVEGNLDSYNYVIIDDFIDTGKTIQEIRKKILDGRDYAREQYPYDMHSEPPQCFAVVLYSDYGCDTKKVIVQASMGYETKYLPCQDQGAIDNYCL